MAFVIYFWLLLVVSSTQALNLLRVRFANKLEMNEFETFSNEKELDVWSMTEKFAEVSVSPDDEKAVKLVFKADVQMYDIEKKADEEMRQNKKSEKDTKVLRTFGAPISYFARYNEIGLWMRQLDNTYDFVSFRKIGKTFEGRDMAVVRIGIGPETKPAVFVMSGIHAREWLTVPTVLYFINQLVLGVKFGNKRITDLLSKYDFYFSPVSNPDGYEFSRINGSTRLWRKTRPPVCGGCIGVDPNRNFDVDFGRKGSSSNPCAPSYAGPRAFSELCTTNLQEFALSPPMKGRIKLFYDVHAYAQMYFVPFSFNKSHKADDDSELRRVANISVEALTKVNGRHFRIGSPAELLREASGSTLDWFKLYAGVKYSYGLEIFPKAGSRIRFLARPSDIEPSGKEISEAILTAAENMRI